MITGLAPGNEELKVGLENLLEDYESEDEFISELNELTQRHSEMLEKFKSHPRGQSQAFGVNCEDGVMVVGERIQSVSTVITAEVRTTSSSTVQR